MDENFSPQQPESHLTHAHETTDANPFALGLFGAALALMIAVVVLMLGWAFGRFEAAAERSDRSASAISAASAFSGPKLQSQPSADLVRLRDDEHQRLSRYEWLDKKRGTVRIPIERAMAILAERGFPEPKQAVRPTKQKDLIP